MAVHRNMLKRRSFYFLILVVAAILALGLLYTSFSSSATSPAAALRSTKNDATAAAAAVAILHPSQQQQQQQQQKEKEQLPVKNIPAPAVPAVVVVEETINTPIPLDVASTPSSSVSPADLKWFEKVEEGTPLDWEKFGNQLRIFKKFHEREFTSPASLSPEEKSFYERTETTLFPWIQSTYPTTISMRQSFKGDGMVICVGNGLTKLAVSTIRMIREVHLSNIPFEVFYIGDADLDESNRKLLEALPFTTTKDITKIFNNEILNLGGWAIKSFALMASSFENAMLIDSDVIFLQSPETLFASHLYRKHGALFFHDRSLFSHEDKTVKWFKDLMPSPPSPYAQKLRVLNGKSAHEQESGVVLVNKKKNFAGLLASCFLNVGEVRNVAYKYVFGDKETFWLGFETVQADYSFNGYYPGSVGVPTKKEDGTFDLCARQILHVDEHRVPTWLNGGIAESKYDDSTPLVDMKSYMMEPGQWSLGKDNMACISIDRTPIEFDSLQGDIIKSSGAIWLEVRKSH